METVFVAVCPLALMPIVYGAGIHRERHRVAADRKARAAQRKALYDRATGSSVLRSSLVPVPFDYEMGSWASSFHEDIGGIDVYPMTRRFTKVDK